MHAVGCLPWLMPVHAGLERHRERFPYMAVHWAQPQRHSCSRARAHWLTSPCAAPAVQAPRVKLLDGSNMQQPLYHGSVPELKRDGVRSYTAKVRCGGYAFAGGHELLLKWSASELTPSDLRLQGLAAQS